MNTPSVPSQHPASSSGDGPPSRSGLFDRLRALVRLVESHADLLWWLHSLYALAIGLGVMWLGSRNYNYLRVTMFYIAFIWVTSLVVPVLAEHSELSAWPHRARLVINYFNKNFYQQLLFFLLPVYYASTTVFSRNTFFVVFLAASAVLSTLDIVYDRHLSVRRGLSAVFFAVSLFATVNVMLPVLWSVRHDWSFPVSGVVALLAFVTIGYRFSDWRRWQTWAVTMLCASALAMTVTYGRSFVPPAPLRLLASEFGTAFDRKGFQIMSPVRVLSPGFSGRLHVLTAVYAPLGLEDRVAHRWYQGEALIYASPSYTVRGGRQEGFRLWTARVFKALPEGTTIRVDVETEGGQLVGRTEIGVAGASQSASQGSEFDLRGCWPNDGCVLAGRKEQDLTPLFVQPSLSAVCGSIRVARQAGR